MKTINALFLRHKLGEILQELEDTKEPVLIRKGKEIKAALVPIEDFQKRFLDKLAEEKRKELKDKIRSLAASRIGTMDRLHALQHLRCGKLLFNTKGLDSHTCQGQSGTDRFNHFHRSRGIPMHADGIGFQ